MMGLSERPRDVSFNGKREISLRRTSTSFKLPILRELRLGNLQKILGRRGRGVALQ
ncbi:hypothetical protein A2U01_0063577, partial [Trifolium medium]|nr:hypothetical protein [Trifolium medium]